MAKSYKSSGQETASPHQEQPSQQLEPPGFNAQAEARKLHEAMSGLGTDERVIFDVLRSGRADLNRAIESAFNRMYPEYSLRTWLRDDLDSGDYTKAIQLLGRGDYTLAQKLEYAADGWGADEQKIFKALEDAPASDLAEVFNNAALMSRLHEELNDNDFELAKAYLSGKKVLAAKLLRAVDCWGTDEEVIWRAITRASEEEKSFVLYQPTLMEHLRSDLSASDYLRARRMLLGSWDNVDKIEVGMKGWGTDEVLLLSAIQGLTNTEFLKLQKGTSELTNGISSLKVRLQSEFSGDLEFEALESLHQKRLAFDPEYAVKYREQQAKTLGTDAMRNEGASALVAAEGQSMSTVARLRMACSGAGTDEESIWDVCASIPAEQGLWILMYNPNNVLGSLQSDLSADEYFRVRSALGGGSLGRIQVLKNAVEGVGTNEAQIYSAIDAIIAEGVGAEVLRERSIMAQIANDIDPEMYTIFRTALESSAFTPIMRLQWATARYGTDEELVWEVCGEHGPTWYAGGSIDPTVDEILKSELSTRDYWKAIDLLRGPPESDQDKIERSKEFLERERSSDFSVFLMDSVSDSGENADEAWRDYQVAYNQSYTDGAVSEQERTRLNQAEDDSNYTTAQYREAKASVAQWASQIAITIVGITATILTAGAAGGPFIAALSANAGQIATSMLVSAALKVGIHKAIEGEGYDLESMDTLVDGVGAAIEGGLFVVGNLGAARIMQGASKTKFAGSIGPSVEKVFGGAGKRIMAAGLEGSIDGTLGGMGEGLFRGLANDKTWAGGLGNAFTSISTTTLLHGSLGGAMGLAGGQLFKSLGETFGPAMRKIMAKGGGARPDGMGGGPGQGSVDDLLVKMPEDFAVDGDAQVRMMHAAHETNQRMQQVADEITTEFGLEPTKVGVKGNAFGVEKAADLDQGSFVSKVNERALRGENPQAVGKMKDMSRGRFDVDNIEQVYEVAETLDRRFTEAYGADNVKTTRRAANDPYQRIHVVVRDPATGVHHEWQVGTKSLTTLIEEVSVAVPKGVELHGYDFHVVMYDVLDKLRRADVRAQHGLPDSIVDDIGLASLSKDYNALMVEAGTLKPGMVEPENFSLRLKSIASRLSKAISKLEDDYPGLATKLDTKLAAEKQAKARAAELTQSATGHTRPESNLDGPAARVETPAEPKALDEAQPALREDHQNTGQYAEKKKATPFISDDPLSPTSATQGQLGDCYLIAGCASQVRADPDSIRRLIKVNADGGFTVTLYLRDTWDGVPKPKQIIVDNQFPMRGGSMLYAQAGKSANGQDEMWMAILEKALAKEAGGYGNISGGNINTHVNFGGVSELLTGNKVTRIATGSMDNDLLLRQMAYAMDNNQPLAASTIDFGQDAGLQDAARKLKINGNHAYSVDSIDLDARTVTLRNPWGNSHPTDISVEDFVKYYDKLDLGQATKADGPVLNGALPEGGGQAASLGIGQASDNLPLALVRSSDSGITSFASGQTRNEAQSQMSATHLKPGDILFPGESTRNLFWSHMTSPKLIRFEGVYGGQAAVFFVNPETHMVLVTDLGATFTTGMTLDRQTFDVLLSTGSM
jgi:hypothetical protein